MLKTGNDEKSSWQGLYNILVFYKNLKSLGRWAGKLVMVDATKATACPIGSHNLHVDPGPNGMWEKHFTLISYYTQAMKKCS